MGIKRHKEVEVLGHELHEIKMNSSLWQTCGGPGTGEPDIDMSRIVDKIIDNLGKIKIRSIGVVKINGQTSIFLTSPGLEVLHTGVPSRFAKEEEGIRVWSVEGLDLEDIDVRRPAQNVAASYCDLKETVRELGEDIASGLPTYEEAMRGRCKM